MNIGIAIPTYKNHWYKTKKLLYHLSDCIIKPDCISISCSEINSDIIEDFELIKNDINIEILFSYFKEKYGAWFNRNVAAEKLNTDIISFFDGDDIPHFQRIEILKMCFENNSDTDAIVHNYHYQEGKIDTSVFTKIEMSKINFYKNLINNIDENKIHPIFFDKKFNCPITIKNYHNAHVSIRRHLFQNIKYKNLPYIEDSVFNSDIIKSGCALSYIEDKLSIYNKES